MGKIIQQLDLRTPGLCAKCRRAELERRKRSTLWGYLRSLLNEARWRKDRRGHEVHMDFDQLLKCWERQNGKCALTGWKMTHSREGTMGSNVSMDRIDPHGDYTADNIQLVCAAANYAKHKLTMPEFVRLCKAVLDKHEELLES